MKRGIVPLKTSVKGGLGKLTITDYFSKNPIELTFDPDFYKIVNWYPLNNNYTYHYLNNVKKTFLRPDYCHNFHPDYGIDKKGSQYNDIGVLQNDWVCYAVQKDNLKICESLEKYELSSFTSYFGEYQLDKDMHNLLSDITALTTRITRRVGKQFIADLPVDDYFEYSLKQATPEESSEYIRFGKIYNMYVLMKKVINHGN